MRIGFVWCDLDFNGCFSNGRLYDDVVLISLHIRRTLFGLPNLQLTRRSPNRLYCLDSFLGDEGKTTPEQRFMEYLQIMLTDIAVVHSFLAELDPAFVVCHDFSRVGESEQSSLVASFLAPNADVAERLKDSMIDAVAVTHRSASKILPYDGVDVVSARLQRKFDAFESTLCGSIH